MTAAELISTLRHLNVRVRVENGQLRCTAPEGVMTAELRAMLSAQKAEILAELEKTSAEVAEREQPMRRISRDRSLPLSFAQQRLWFLDQLDPGSSAYNVPKAFRIRGPLDAERIERSLNQVVARHEVLRTTIKIVNGQPEQNIAPSSVIKCSFVDLSDSPAGTRDEKARRLLGEEAYRPFDLARGPLVRALVIRLGTDDYRLLITLHHIASDGWSMGILYREIAAAYVGEGKCISTPLGDLPVQYADFAQWQRDRLNRDVLQNHLRYWNGKLANIQPLNLAADRARRVSPSRRGARESLLLPERLCQSLKRLSQDQRASLFMTLVAALNVLLSRYTGHKDIVIGTPIAGRNQPELEILIGFFVNTLVLRNDLVADPTFVALLGRVRETALDAYAHQDLPFEKLVEELTPERHVGASPVVQVMFAYQNFPAAPFEISGCSTEPIELDTETAKFPLTLLISPAPEGMLCVMSYDTGLFGSESATRMLAHFRNLLDEIVADPNRRISELQILSEGERRQLLLDWNDSAKPYPRDTCIHQLFEAQVAATPDAAAISFAGQRLTYRELNARANRLAHVLRRFGFGAEEMVGICLGRSVEMIVAVLGVLKAGGAYLPLDPGYPTERLAFIVSDARCRIVLSERRFAQPVHAAVLNEVQVVYLDDPCEAGDQESGANPSTWVWPESLAYVMYTSGSTGTPKGVAVTHRNVIRLVKSQDYAEFGEREVFLQFAPLTFDASTFEIWGPLLNGAELVIAPADALSPEQLGAEIERSGVTTLWLTAALFHLMVDQCLESLRGVSQLLAGGDVLSVRHVMRVAKELTSCRLINGYGPTENTTFSCCYPISSAEHLDESVPIGRPINHTQAYVLDEDLALMPRGIPGELYVSGDGLARGYFNKSELTAERFIPHPFAAKAGSRLYRTGDRVRYLPDGNLEFLGRLDHQVKIRGYRIEPGEIESVLEQYPGVREVVVVARQDERGEKILVAYLASPVRLDIGALRSFLKERVPDYMIPAAFVHLNALPLTSSGKVDRKGLPAPDSARPDLNTSFVAPGTPTEEALQRIWSELLHVDEIGIHDDFFELGGHSLLATQVASRVRSQFSIDLPLRSFFENPTVATLAERIEILLWAAGKARDNVEGSEEEVVSL